MDEYASASFRASWRNTPAENTHLKKTNEARDDTNHMDVMVYKSDKERKEDEEVWGDKRKQYSQIVTQGRGNYSDRKEYVSRWNKENYKVKKIEYDSTGNRTYLIEGLTKPILRHETSKA